MSLLWYLCGLRLALQQTYQSQLTHNLLFDVAFINLYRIEDSGLLSIQSVAKAPGTGKLNSCLRLSLAHSSIFRLFLFLEIFRYIGLENPALPSLGMNCFCVCGLYLYARAPLRIVYSCSFSAIVFVFLSYTDEISTMAIRIT